MTGSVIGRQAVIPVVLRLPVRPELTIDFVVDTGFTYFLTLPPAAIASLGLPFLHEMPANLADDSTVNLGAHTAQILWNGTEREVRVLATGRRPLLGTASLDGQELVVQFLENGLVTVNEI